MNILNSYSQPAQGNGQLRSNPQPAASEKLDATGQQAQADESRNLSKAQDTVLNRLAEHVPGVTAEDMRRQKAEDFTPEKVAERISGFVSQGLANARAEGRSEEDVQKMHAAAVRGIEKGFAEAKDILQELDILSQGNIEKTIDDTFDKTMESVRALLPDNPLIAGNNSGPQAPARSSEEFYAAERYSKAETFSLKLKTQEGDDVVIEFGNSSSQTASIGAVNNANGYAHSASIERYSSSNMSFSIQGDLNEKEMKAIDDLLKDVNDIADEFFGGDMQAAFDKATEFQMDGSQLASMNLQLTRTETYSAASAYSSVGNMLPGAEKLAPLNDLGTKLGTLAEDPRNAFLDKADAFISEMLDSLVKQDIRFKDADDAQQSLLSENLDKMNSMLDTLFERSQKPAVEAPASEDVTV